MPEEKQGPGVERLQAIGEFFKAIWHILITFGTGLALIYAAVAFIEYRVQSSVNSPEFLDNLSRRIRPYVIFDENESILVDMGGMDYLERIEVRKDKDGGFGPRTIIVTPKEHLAQAPLVERVGAGDIDFKSRRGKGHQWIYECYINEYSASMDEVVRFRLYILK